MNTNSNNVSPNTEKKLDIAICIIPKIVPECPTIGPALLKSHLLAEGFSCEVMDLNISLYNHLKKDGLHKKYYFEDDSIFKAQNKELSPEFLQFYKNYEHVFFSWIDRLKEKKPAYIGFSLLTGYSQSVAIKFGELVRINLPDAKIIWGGPQITRSVERFADRNLFDHYITGDAEFSIVELLKKNMTYSGINKAEVNQVENLDSILIPNYDDINWSDYEEEHLKQPVYITGSRGCVRRCTFCDVEQIWPKYKFRTPEHVLAEIKHLYHVHNRRTFKFTDSLINGSLRNYRHLLQEFKKFRVDHPDFRWMSQWIIRPKEFSPKEDFLLLKESGCIWLELGLESFSEDVRYHMGKKFSNIDVDWCLSMLQEYGIPASLLMIVGYPTETEQDHINTLAKIEELFNAGYVNNKNSDGFDLIHLCFCSTLMLDPSMPLWNLIKDDISYFKSDVEWTYKDNSLNVRVRRLNEINSLIFKLKNDTKLHWQILRTIREQNETNKKTLAATESI